MNYIFKTRYFFSTEHGLRSKMVVLNYTCFEIEY